MSNIPNNPFGASQRVQPLDYQERGQALSVAAFFNAVYAWMAVGLGVTTLVAWVVANNARILQQVIQPIPLIAMIVAEIALVVIISRAINAINATAATALFLLYAALNGVTLSVLLLIYSHESLAGAFLVSAGMFGAMSLYGLMTKRDLSAYGSLLFMALIGLILASIVNVFVASSGLYWLITYAGVLIFVALTAYDTQRLRVIAFQTSNDAALASRLSIVGALTLYLDFVNLFIYILRIMGKRR